MSRVIVANTDADPSSLAGKVSTKIPRKLRESGIIVLSAPPKLTGKKLADWVNTTGYKAELGDIYLEITAREAKKPRQAIFYASQFGNQGKQVAKSISSAFSEQKFKLIANNREFLASLEPIGVNLAFDLDENQRQEDSIAELVTNIVAGVNETLGVQTVTDSSRDNDEEKEKKNQEPDQKPVKPKPGPELKTPQLKTTPPKKPTALPQFTPPSFNPPSFDAPSFDAPNFNPPNLGVGNSIGSNSNSPGNAPKQLSRDERKKMVQENYKKAFGKEPEQSDLNYFLNIGISEEQLLKRILESQDHVDLIADAKKYRELKQIHDKLEQKAQDLETKLKDQREVLEKLNALLLQKNRALGMLQRKQVVLAEKLEEMQEKQGYKPAKIDYEPTRIEKIINYLSRQLS